MTAKLLAFAGSTRAGSHNQALLDLAVAERNIGKVAILRSTIGAHIDRERPWADWSIGTPRHRPVQYEHLSEYRNVHEDGGRP